MRRHRDQFHRLFIPKFLDEVIGTNFEVVLGYQAGQDIDLAVERNEVVCRRLYTNRIFRP